ncbi:hypothetical protein N7456_004657 [Penicillium angulare]|uniref:PBP domain-containing protein n=1 Tax=Penicillium angulare TaxID=116970 RepID=A0A9W9FWZ4_9EURO|nr:hypothetical protein N7456_004657 [Penicillium angulare]
MLSVSCLAMTIPLSLPLSLSQKPTLPSPNGLFGPASAVGPKPEAVYDGDYGTGEIKLRIGNGGAGQSGLIKVLADAFIKSSVANGSSPFKIAWYKSDTTQSINYLKDNTVDIGITYTPAAETIATNRGIAKAPAYYAFRDRFILVGPKSNPANLTSNQDILSMFANIFSKAEEGATVNGTSVRFLARYDKSATNIKDSQLWIGIGQVPWATAYSTWYHQYIAYPVQALKAAILLKEYTLTDRGTLLSIDEGLREKVKVYKVGSDEKDDLLLNPAHMLVGRDVVNEELAGRFAEWVISEEGQGNVTSLFKSDKQLYDAAPDDKTAPF